MDKEKTVRDLINTFNDRDELHEAYKKKVKQILEVFVQDLMVSIKNGEDGCMSVFIDSFVEKRFKPEL